MYSVAPFLLAASSFAGAALATPGTLKIDFARETESQFAKRASGYVDLELDQREYNMRYLADLSIGTPPQSFQLIVDTGSSDLWVPYAQSELCRSQDGCVYGAFHPASSSTYAEYGQFGSFNISYDSANTGEVGYYFNDTVKVAGQSVAEMTIGLAVEDSIGQGLLGVGFQSLESISQRSNFTTAFPTIVDALVTGGHIGRKAFSLYLNDLDASTGSLLFGGIDTSKYSGDLIALPMQEDSQVGIVDRYLVTLTSISFQDNDGTHLLSPSDMESVSLLDSGTPLMVLPQDIANALYAGVGAFVYDSQTTIVPCNYANSPANLTFGFGGEGGPTISVPMKELVFKGILQPDATFENGDQACLFGVQGSGSTLDGSLILGDTFLRSAYVVYDLDNFEIAIAQASYDSSSENIQAIPAGSDAMPGVSSTATLSATLAAPLTAFQTAPATSAAPSLLTEAKPTFALGTATADAGTGAAASTGGSAGTAAGSGSGGAATSTSSSVAVGGGVYGASFAGQGVVVGAVGLGLVSLVGAFVL